MTRGPEFNWAERMELASKLQQADAALASQDMLSAEGILESIFPQSRILAQRTASIVAYQEEAQDIGKFFRALKISERLQKLMFNLDDSDAERFHIWKADQGEISRHWNTLTSLKGLFKDDKAQFDSNLNQMDPYSVDACTNLAFVYSLVLSTKLTNHPDGFTSRNLQEHIEVTQRLVGRAEQLRRNR